jgi:8-amino-3,8-dideoxy-alpha-D-manno-octulosonate transaminase
MGDMAIYSHQVSKTITCGDGGSLVTNDPLLFERACRFHAVGNLRSPHLDAIGTPKCSPVASTNFRMNEFTGGVMLAQLRKLDTIIAAVRANTRRVYDGIRDLPGIHLRHLPDPEGELGTGVFLGFDRKERRNRFMAAMKAENVPARPPGGSVILPVEPYIENKVTVHPAWPSWTSARGKAIRYGAASCPRTIDILSRFAGVYMDPKYTRRDTDDIVAAIRKVYPAIVRSA